MVPHCPAYSKILQKISFDRHENNYCHSPIVLLLLSGQEEKALTENPTVPATGKEKSSEG